MLRWPSVWETGAGADLYRSAGEWAARFGSPRLAPASWAKVSSSCAGIAKPRGPRPCTGVNDASGGPQLQALSRGW